MESYKIPGAGMGGPDNKLHIHARFKAEQYHHRDYAYSKAAGAWCPECGSSAGNIENNGLHPTDPDFTYLCVACDHQWTPNAS